MKFLIIGGTGTLGQTLIKKLRASGHEIACFSRDELKQQELKKIYPDVRYILGDIRDKQSVITAMYGIDTVFHVAALKHVDVLEANPIEAIKTNILGTINVAEAAMECMVGNVIFSSTDKAVLPINVYGMTKSISERYLLNLNGGQQDTKFAVYRWANVMGSRGSVVHSFAASIKETGGVKITDPRMTRFWINIDDAADFMLKTYKKASLKEVMIPDMKASTVMALADAVCKAVGQNEYKIEIVGIRPGEKIHECLYSSHDLCLRSDTAEKYTHHELIEMVKKVL